MILAILLGSFAPIHLVPASSADSDFHISITVDLGADLGQNFGSLFEARDRDGRTVLGAGFLGASNTRIRSHRHTLNFFVQPQSDEAWSAELETLPRPSPDAGVYLHHLDHSLFAATRSGATDSAQRRWSHLHKTWNNQPITLDQTLVSVWSLERTSGNIFFDARRLLELPADGPELRFGYYAKGTFLGRLWRRENPAINRLIATPWRSDSSAPMEISQAITLDLPSEKDFVYAAGQLGDHLLVATNTGGVYRFDTSTKTWAALVEPDYGTSFQIYTMVNFYDELLLGQYPSGELWRYRGGDAIERLPGWPPVLKGVSKRAREAQTAVIYGGQLMVGVWPWGEVWRYDRYAGEWKFFRRLFTEPELSDEITHPYEAEMIAREAPVRNLWGQRVTSMVPISDSLYLSTSAKSALAFDAAKYPFVHADERWREYGAVHRFELPGQLAVSMQWTGKKTTFEFIASERTVTVLQDGKELGSTSLPDSMPDPSDLTFSHGAGVYGQFAGEIAQFERR